MKRYSITALAAILVFASCSNTAPAYDASGVFETEETIISSEASGTIKQFDVHEGDTLRAGQLIGYIDSTQLFLKKKQLEAQIKAVLIRKPKIATQTAALQEQLKAAEKEQARITNMVKEDAATPRQLDEIDAQVSVLKKQIEAQYSSLNTSSEGISQEATPLHVQIEQVNDQLARYHIVNPVKGTVLATYSLVNEVTAPGKPLYKVADLSTMILRAYVTGNQFSTISVNRKVRVMVDNGKDSTKKYEGIISWISDKAEFTPKTIQTKDERANLVYAVKINVKNDGLLKIGMYGEVKF